MTSFKNILYILVFGATLSASAQLFVKPSGPVGSEVPSYVFVDDTFIYVEQDVELEINPVKEEESSIILRNEAQLLQGNGVDQDNKGTGDISLFQEGTSSAWNYNYWASPVGLAFASAGTAAPDGNGVFAFRDSALLGYENSVFFVPTSLTNSSTALLNPTFDGVSGPNELRIAYYWIWSFQSGENYSNWNPIQDLNTLDAGYGFTMKGTNGSDPTDIYGDGVVNNDNNPSSPNGQRYDFRGRPNNGHIDVSVGLDRLTLVGNPYPSALDLNYFLLENSAGTFTTTDINGNTVNITGNGNTTGIALYWDSDPTLATHYLEEYEGGYGTYSPDMGINTAGTYVNAPFFMYDDTGSQTGGQTGTGGAYQRRFAPIGQGFMIEGTANATVTFKNDHRVFAQEGTNSDFKNNDEPKPVIGVRTYYPNAAINNTFPKVKIAIGINDTYSRELAVVLHNNATSGYDVAGDAQIGGLATDVSFVINQQKGYVINNAPVNELQELPLTLDAETAAEYRFFAHDTENFTYEGVYLLDKETQTYYDIYTESVLIQLEAGEHSNRFAIVFKKEQDDAVNSDNETLSTDDITLETGILESFNVIQNNTSRQLEIYNPLNISLDKMSLYDMAGKLVISEDQLGAQSIYTFPTGNLSSGIYIAQFVTDEGLTKARKISVNN